MGMTADCAIRDNSQSTMAFVLSSPVKGRQQTLYKNLSPHQQSVGGAPALIIPRGHCQTVIRRVAVPTACEGGKTELKADPPFPTLYDAWFGPTHQLTAQVQDAITKAYADGIRDMELQWPVVPNLEEIAAGTKLNFEFGKFVARELGMADLSDYQLIKRYLASFCNLYWVREIANAEPFRERTVWAIATDSVSKKRAEEQLRNVKLGTLRRPPDIGGDDVVVIIDPRFNEVWQKGMKLKPKNGCVIFLNSQFNESYGLTGPRRGIMKNVRPVYFLRRITRGYVYYVFPGPWRACLEKPDLGIEELGHYEEEPKLRTVALQVREESNNRYGGFNNDRYVQGFGGRL